MISDCKTHNKYFFYNCVINPQKTRGKICKKLKEVIVSIQNLFFLMFVEFCIDLKYFLWKKYGSDVSEEC